jgi:DNA-binding response OmpR family regulator
VKTLLSAGLDVCVLLVEDEPLIRVVLAEELSHAGFEVCEAENGTQAAELIENPPNNLSLLITDIHMPGKLDGIEVAHLMRTRFPDVPIIYMTGRPDVLGRMGGLGATEALLPKPFTPSSLLGMARQLLAGQLASGAANRAT